jgi:hypothetical protein
MQKQFKFGAIGVTLFCFCVFYFNFTEGTRTFSIGGFREATAQGRGPLAVIVTKILTINILLFGHLVTGQNCDGIYEKADPIVRCVLSGQLRNDTVDSFIPSKCNKFSYNPKHGIFKLFSSDSVLVSIRTISDGEQEGPYISFSRNGQILMSGYYSKDKFTGIETEFWRNGNLARKVVVKANLIEKEEYFDETGTKTTWDAFVRKWYDCDHNNR